MRFEYSQIAFEDALQQVVLGISEEEDRDFEPERGPATALLDWDTTPPPFQMRPHVEHDGAD